MHAFGSPISKSILRTPISLDETPIVSAAQGVLKNQGDFEALGNLQVKFAAYNDAVKLKLQNSNLFETTLDLKQSEYQEARQHGSPYGLS